MAASRPSPKRYTRRDFLKVAGVTAAAAACAPTGGTTTTLTGTTLGEPSTGLSGDLKILQWSHFVPQYDKWFDPFAQQWAENVGVNVTVDHVAVADLPAAAASEIQAGEGHDLIEFISPPSNLEPSVIPMNDIMTEAERRFGPQVPVATRSTFNPTTGNFFAFSHGWVPDPGDYRKSLWEQVGLPNGPLTWDELLTGGAEIKSRLGVQMGIGMSQEIDSNMAGRALLWSYGASIQDENENVVINSDEAVDAVEFMTRLFRDTMTDEVFAWNAASNNQGLIAGELSYILNSISAYRTAQKVNPEVADDVFFVPALIGPGGQWAAEHVMYGYFIPKHARNVDAAQEFILHLVANYNQAVFNSEIYNFPSFFSTAPQLFGAGTEEDPGWIGSDPFQSRPLTKLEVLRTSEDWSTNIGHPGPANTAIGEVFATFIIPNMFAKAARGEMTPAEAVADAEAQIIPIFDKWRADGLVGGGS